MIAADTSAWIDFFKGRPHAAADRLQSLLEDEHLVMPMPVLFEILSGPGLPAEGARLISLLPRIEILPAHWERAAEMRKKVLRRRLRARSMDCLIAQSCIDHGTPLLAAGEDFRHFTRHGLALA